MAKEVIKLIFKTLHMIVENKSITRDDISKLVFGAKNKYEHRNEVYLIERKYVENRYLWMYCQYDNSKLYGEVVLDTMKEKQHKNTRKKNEVELRKQLFVIIDSETHLVYISDIAKKGMIKEYLSEELQADVIIKNVYSSLDEFQDAIKYLKKLKFTQQRNIMNVVDNESIFMQQVSELGLDMPEKITMQIEYPNTLIGSLRNGIQNIKQKREQGYFKDIVLIGVDDSGIEQSFDFSSVVKNIEILTRKNEDERYDNEEVEAEDFLLAYLALVHLKLENNGIVTAVNPIFSI